MQKGREEDEMLDQTLKAIEIVNISDMSAEREGLIERVDVFKARKNELDKQEEELLREKAKKDARKGPGRRETATTNKEKIGTPPDNNAWF